MMLGEEDKGRPPIGHRKSYLRSVSWSDRSPRIPKPRPQTNNKARLCLPPLLPLSISKKNVVEWPKPGSDDLGVWPQPPTPREGGNCGSEETPKEFQLKKDKECSRIVDHIYIGSDAVAKDRRILCENGITHVLNCVGFACPEYFKDELVYKTLWLQDNPSEDITSILYDVFDYFEDVRVQNGRVLVHCRQGVSRSTSLVIAYLMWREGKSFEDAFHYVKVAREVTNPNMGFACQLLQCQKRVHGAPTSPNSRLRMFRVAPHSPYDPLHLVPKLLSHPCSAALDSRGAFLIRFHSATYIWIGRICAEVMSNTARAAALQVICYERAQGPIVTIKEGEETLEFWHALENDAVSAVVSPPNGQRKVDEYDLDFEIFLKALDGGVIPQFPLPGTISETHLPARENGWRQCHISATDPSLSSSSGFGSPESLSPFQMENPHRISYSAPFPEPLLPSELPCGLQKSYSKLGSPLTSPLTSPCVSPDSFPCAKSVLNSPSTSGNSSPFTFSPSSSRWSESSNLSSQSSPSGLESEDRYISKNISFDGRGCLLCRATPPSRMENTCKGISTCCLATRRGSNPPRLMILPLVDEASHDPRDQVGPWSFSLPRLEDDIMSDVEDCRTEQDDSYGSKKEELSSDMEIYSDNNE